MASVEIVGLPPELIADPATDDLELALMRAVASVSELALQPGDVHVHTVITRAHDHPLWLLVKVSGMMLPVPGAELAQQQISAAVTAALRDFFSRQYSCQVGCEVSVQGGTTNVAPFTR
jgi:hypothetical protein